jgi:hypothetical protein
MLPRTWASFSSVTGANSISQSMAWDHWNLLAGEELDYAVKIVHLLYGFYFFSLPQKNTNYTYFPFSFPLYGYLPQPEFQEKRARKRCN